MSDARPISLNQQLQAVLAAVQAARTESAVDVRRGKTTQAIADFAVRRLEAAAETLAGVITKQAAVTRHRHRNGGLYRRVGEALLQTADGELADMTPMVVYRSEADGSLWVRSRAEFEDGRFVALASGDA